LTGAILATIAGLLIAINVFCAIGCYSLRNFSRSRLDEICRKRKKETRFSTILMRHERAGLSVELFFTLSFVGLVVYLVTWLELSNLPTGETVNAERWAVFVSKWMGVILVLIFAPAILPWTIARVWGEAFLFRFWPIIASLELVFRPLISFAQLIDRSLHRLSGRGESEKTDAATLTEEILSVVDEGQRGGVLESGARRMIHRVMEMAEEDAAAVMTPRTDMFCISADDSLEEARQKLLEAGHTRVPVIGKSTDDIVGVLYAKDLLRHIDETTDRPDLKQIVREPFYIPETASVDSILETMKRKHVHLAIVLDEYGGVAGLVTLEDILEEIVGEIEDEYDRAEVEPIRDIRPGVSEVEARVHIDDLNDRFGYELPEADDYETIGGFVTAHLGRIPEVDESFVWGRIRFTVLEADKRKLIKLQLEEDKSPATVAADDD
jgi:CBS domain containing-hemolysin-like protein